MTKATRTNEEPQGAQEPGKDLRGFVQDHPHTFLFVPGTWEAKGDFFDSDGRPSEVSGQAVITHRPKSWTNDTWMRLPGGSVLRNVYQMLPWPRGACSTTWSSENPALGLLHGRFGIAHDSIFAHAWALDGEHTSQEYLLMLDQDRYLNRGVFFRGDAIISSWAVELTRTA